MGSDTGHSDRAAAPTARPGHNRRVNGTWILLVVIAAVAVTGLANRGNLQAPLVLVTIGSIASFLPGMPRLELHPDIILGVVLPPLLYSAALRFSVATFRRHLAPILRLGIFTVLVTAFAVAFSASALVPDLTLGAALVLGAVVAPTDAVSAVAVGQRLGLPKRVIAVLTGEGLVNDATALTLFTVAVSAVAGTRVLVDSPVVFFGYEVAGGVAIGLLLAVVVHRVRGRMYDSPLETVLGLVLPFTAYLAAEEIEASGVLAVVAAGLYMGHRATDASVATRIQERAVWESLDVLLEMFVFAYMGLQLKFVIDEVRESGLDVHRAFLYAFAVLGVVIAVRPLWVLLHWARRRLTREVGLDRLGRDQFTGREYLVISWAGMRGVVTLAAAGGVPLVLASGEPFPGRETIQVIAFVVAVGTLLIQGATMPALIRVLNVADPYERLYAQEQMERARTISGTAAEQHLALLAKNPPDGVDAEALQRILARVNRSMKARLEAQQAEEAGEHEPAVPDSGTLFEKLRRSVLRAQRQALIAARDNGDLDDETLRTVLEGLDVEEAAAEERLNRRTRY
ncbi:Na+/H+ antiporter [Rhodococcus aetherivorans]|uniref:Na+/H+ antiporter n=1 Tax=Rhodococcus aetherivorans TaxID=191292 RepID=A0ABQ0YM38_9NOCA|nr:Na+/H+ antiporter [Rhodococcus rhodochrous ATCC 21198]GES37514.1 Na+/H+ antiporter [Rhodococcus aetherivorans]CCW14941.1 Na+/H+ antiporter [Rhodococcus aetherivorans]